VVEVAVGSGAEVAVAVGTVVEVAAGAVVVVAAGTLSTGCMAAFAVDVATGSSTSAQATMKIDATVRIARVRCRQFILLGYARAG